MHTNLNPSSHSPIYSIKHIMHTDLNPSSHSPIYSPEHLHTSHAQMKHLITVTNLPHEKHPQRHTHIRNTLTQTFTHTWMPNFHSTFPPLHVRFINLYYCVSGRFRSVRVLYCDSQHISIFSHTLNTPIVV